MMETLLHTHSKWILILVGYGTFYTTPYDELMHDINRIPGKSVHARAFAHERLQSPVSYVGIDMLSRTILKTMYPTISNSTFDGESRSHTTKFRTGTESNLPAAQDKSCTLQLMPASNRGCRS